MLALLVVQAVALSIWSAAASASASHMLLELAPLAAAFAVAARTGLSRRARASAMAIGLFTESALAVHLADGAVVVHFHYFVMLCVLALYEDVAAFGLGVGYVVLQHGVMGSLAPQHVFGGAGESAHPWIWATVHGVFLLAAAAALVANWRANANVRASERRHRERAERYLDVAGALLVVLDVEGRIRVANRMTCATLQRDEADLVGADWFTLAVPGEEQASSRRVHESLMAGELDGHDAEHRVVRPDGSSRLVRFTVTLLRDEEGRITGTLSSGIDVTDRRALDDRLAREQRDLAALRRLAQDVASLEDARPAVIDHVADLTDAAFAALLEPTGDLDLLVTAATPGNIFGERIRVGRETSGGASAFMSGRPFFVADGHGHPAVHQRLLQATGAASIIYQPVVVDGETRGVLVVGWAERVDSLGTRQTDLVELAAGEAAVALQRLAALRRLESAAMLDALTGVPNRRAFDAALDAALKHAERSGGSLALAYMDLNDFKGVNDRDGHQAGDRLLKAVASAWQAQLRQTDMLARLGGDEFAVLLPDCGPDDVDVVAQRLRRAVHQGPGCAVGAVRWDGEESGAALLRRADHELYADKAGGGRARISDPTRLAALDATGLLAGGGAAELDELSRIAAWVLDVPIVTISLVDDRRQFFAGQCGVSGWAAQDRGTPLSHSFCQHAVSTGRPLVIADARTSPLLRDNPAIREQGVIAYAGIPLIDAAGNTLGVLCAIDHEPRAWSEDEVATLRGLAQRTIREIAALGDTGANATS
jgi:diguanylate cyclase (GGDEF)-like protein/PAS domain S-box-containing protein